MTEAQKLKKRLRSIFGEGSQTAFARLLTLAGDKRPHKTILRSINAYANGQYATPGEIWAIVRLLEKPGDIPEMIRQARREPDAPAFQLLPAPKAERPKKS